MGGVVKTAGRAVSSALGVFGSQKSESDYYKSLAADADRQAAYTAAASARENTYLFKSAAERSKEIYEDYRRTAGRQKTALAASGAGNYSATAQRMLKTSRLNALLDEENVLSSMRDALYENDAAAAERVRNLNVSASQYRRAAKNRWSGWTWGSNLLSFFTELK